MNIKSYKLFNDIDAVSYPFIFYDALSVLDGRYIELHKNGRTVIIVYEQNTREILGVGTYCLTHDLEYFKDWTIKNMDNYTFGDAIKSQAEVEL